MSNLYPHDQIDWRDRKIDNLEKRLAESEAGAAAYLDQIKYAYEVLQGEGDLYSWRGAETLDAWYENALSSTAGKSFIAERDALLKVCRLSEQVLNEGEPVDQLIQAHKEVATLRSPNPGQDAEASK